MKKFLPFLFLAAWTLLQIHPHADHVGGLHAGHPSCQICLQASYGTNPSLALPGSQLFPLEKAGKAAALWDRGGEPAVSSFRFQPRAPPAA